MLCTVEYAYNYPQALLCFVLTLEMDYHRQIGYRCSFPVPAWGKSHPIASSSLSESQTWHGQKRSWERKGQDNSTRFDAVKRMSSCTMLFLRVINSSQLLRCLWLVEICFCPIALATIMCLLWYSTFTLLPTCKFKNASNTVNGTFSDSCDLNHPSQSSSLDCPSTL